MCQIIYKCRLCGRTYVSGGTGSRNTAIKYMFKIIDNVDIDSDSDCPIRLLDTHFCDDGSLGVADFLGFREEKE